MEYELCVSARARTMRVAVYPGGAVRVTVPRRYSERSLARFLHAQRAWIERTRVKMDGETIEARREDIQSLKRDAERIVRERCAYFAGLYDVRFNKISIRAQKSRWGSCSKAGNLSFNYKLALLPGELQDYIVIHELCHLIHFDHSKDFWREVERFAPDHRTHRARLRRLAFRFR